MSEFFTEEEVLVRVGPLTREHLSRFVTARMVHPSEGERGRIFRPADLARLELLCDLCDAFEMQDDALDLVMSLIDQLHGVRAELKAVMDALSREPEEVRTRVMESVYVARARGR